MKDQTQLITLLIKSRGITQLRKKYDPSYSTNFPNHLNLVYSFSGINQKELFEHINNSIKNIRNFRLK